MPAPEFTCSQAGLRLRRLQQLCHAKGLDGILLVPGLDGRFNPGSHCALGWLLEGRSNRDTIDVTRLEGEGLEEAAALVTPSELRLFAPSPAAAQAVQALLGPTAGGLRTFGPTAAEAADPDAAEDNKVACFVQMLRGCKRLGIPCNLAAPAAPAGPAPSAPPRLSGAALVALERWPLLQAYGHEGVGRGGFFTMNFEVYDVYGQLQRLYGELDGRALALLLAEGAPTLRQHWDEMLGTLGGKAAGQRGGVSEKQVAEPLAGYFAYGLLRAAEGVEQSVTLPPRAVFGARSSDDAAAAESAPLCSLGAAPGAAPTHGVVEGADARSGLRAARSLFLSRGVAERNTFADAEEEAEEGYSFEAASAAWAAEGRGAEAVRLMRLYTALVEAAGAAMAHFATVDGATALSAKAEAQAVLARRAEQLGVAGGGGGGGGGGAALASRLRFALLQVDHANRVTAPAVRGSRQLKVLRLSLPDDGPRPPGPLAGQPLGGLVYGDTFLDLPPAVQEGGGGGGGGGGGLLVLTEGVPVLLAVPVGGAEEELAARALRGLARATGAAAGAQSASAYRPASRAAQLDGERRAAASAATDSEAMAARLRARRPGGQEGDGAEGEEEADEEGLEGEGEEAGGRGGGRPSPAAALGRLLTLGGGDDAVLLTGSPSVPALCGALHCFSAGLVFVEAASRAVWALDLRPGGGVEALTLQRLQAAGAGRAGAGGGNGLGEAVVFRGCSPACGLAPAAHTTTNTYLALPLEAMAPAARRVLIASVLPAWQQTCREAAAAASSAASASAASYLKDMAADDPFPPELHAAHARAVMSSGAVVAGDGGAAEAALQGLDAAELRGALSGLDPQVEALLLPPPPPPPAAGASPAPALSITLVAGLPGADQTAAAGAVAAMLAGAVVRVAFLPYGPGPLRSADFAAALAEAAGAAAAPRGGAVRHHLVLATSSYVGLHEQLRMLAAAVAGGGGGAAAAAGGGWRLASVVSCVSADVAAEEPGRGAAAGGWLGQLAPGCVDCVVLGGADAAKASALAQLVSERLPDVPQVRAGRAQLLRAREELLPPPAERAARLAAPAAVAARRWAPLAGAERQGGGGGACGGLLGPLQAARVAFEGALDVAKLREELRALGLPRDPPASAPPLPLADAAASPTAAVAGLVAVAGCARLAPAAGAGAGAGAEAGVRLWELVGGRQAALRVREWPLGAEALIGGPRLPSDPRAPGGELLLVGTGAAMAEPALRALLARCAASPAGSAPAAPAPAPAPPASAAGLSAATRAAIRAAHLFDPLPEGYCFNGTQYFDAFGEASLEHPEMARIVDEWLAEARARAERGREEAEAEAASRGGAGGPAVTRVEGPFAL